MGKSLRSKRMRANRIRKRIVNRPKVLKKLKEALTFEYNEETENAHLSIFNEIVNGPLPNDGTYFEPSVTVLEKTEKRYESFLTRKIPKIAEIARKNLVRPIEDPQKNEDGENDVQGTSKGKKKPPEDIVLQGHEFKPSKSGSWPKWMNQRTIKNAARNRRKNIKRIVSRERRVNKCKGNQKTNKKARKNTSNKTTPNEDVEMKDS